MNHLPERIQKVTDEFVGNLRECFGENLLDVTLYGPAARGEQAKGSAATFMVVVRDNTPSELAPCSVFMKKWARHGIATPLFITPEYIRDSLDSFPLEFMEMKSSYLLLAGTDFLADLEFAPCDIRKECEREIKGKLLHLRAEYLALRGDRKGVTDLVLRSLNTFRLVFAGALALKHLPAPEPTSDLFLSVAGAYGIDEGFIRNILGIARGEIKAVPAETDRLFDQYVEELDKLSTAIDAFCFPEDHHE